MSKDCGVMGCLGVWILSPSGDIVLSGVHADTDIIERISEESRLAYEGRESSQTFCPGGAQWVHLFPIRNPPLFGTLAVWEDRSAEEELRLEIKSMAHDINNLLAVSHGHLELLEMSSGNGNNASLTEALWMLTRAEDLVSRLGAVSFEKNYGSSGESTDVHDALRHLTALLPDRYQAGLEIPEKLPFVSMDPGDFVEVFQNLTQNACEAMPDGGAIHIQVKLVERDVVIAIRDHGKGIDAAVIHQIFSPHFTTKSGGHGLGLYRTRKLVEKCGGNIHVVSTPGVGSTFMVSLPQKPIAGHQLPPRKSGFR